MKKTMYLLLTITITLAALITAGCVDLGNDNGGEVDELLNEMWGIIPALCTVSFNTNGVTPDTIADRVVYCGNQMGRDFPNNPTRAGYIFDRWFEDGDTTTRYDPLRIITRNVELIAKWEDSTYQVTVVNGTTMCGDSLFKAGDTVKVIANTPPAGQRFSNWTAENNSVTFMDSSDTITTFIMPANRVTVDANFVLKTYSVIWNANGGRITDSAQTSVNHGDSITAQAKVERNGYVFRGWYTDSTFTTPADFLIEITKCMTLWAKWGYTVTFNTGGGPDVAPITGIASGVTVSLPDPLDWLGLHFVGWYTDTAHKNLWDSEREVVIGDTTLFAKWVLRDTRDGLSYTVVKIGNNIWMARNLMYMDDGWKRNYDFVVENGVCASWCYYDEDIHPDSCNKYGRLYTWDAALVACPDGWRLPTMQDWWDLIDFAGGSTIAGSKLKATLGWHNTGNGTDEFGFSALPGGLRNNTSNNMFNEIGTSGNWWSSGHSTDFAVAAKFNMHSDNNSVYTKDHGKVNALSVRCVRK